jgi:hypothetical protein
MWADDDSQELPPLIFRDGTKVSSDTKVVIKDNGKNEEAQDEEKKTKPIKKYIIPGRKVKPENN